MASYSPGAPTSPVTAREKYASTSRLAPPASIPPSRTAEMNSARRSRQSPEPSSVRTSAPPFPLRTSIVAQRDGGNRRQLLPASPGGRNRCQNNAGPASILTENQLRRAHQPLEFEDAALRPVDGPLGLDAGAALVGPADVADELVHVLPHIGVEAVGDEPLIPVDDLHRPRSDEPLRLRIPPHFLSLKAEAVLVDKDDVALEHQVAPGLAPDAPGGFEAKGLLAVPVQEAVADPDQVDHPLVLLAPGLLDGVGRQGPLPPAPVQPHEPGRDKADHGLAGLLDP